MNINKEINDIDLLSSRFLLILDKSLGAVVSFLQAHNATYSDYRDGVNKGDKNVIIIGEVSLSNDCFRFASIITNAKKMILIKDKKGTALSSKKLWEMAARNSKDVISAGGWQNSYTRQLFSKEELEEYSNNIRYKLRTIVHSSAKVLEIGCASGISMKTIAPFVSEYHAVDFSPFMLNVCRQTAMGCNITNVKFDEIEAIDILTIAPKAKYDIIILNSVAHLFPSEGYLRAVCEAAGLLLSENGHLFIGDVLWFEKKELFLDSLRTYKQLHSADNTKTDYSRELFVPQFFWQDLITSSPSFIEASFSTKIGKIENELFKYRYDIILRQKTKTKHFELIIVNW